MAAADPFRIEEGGVTIMIIDFLEMIFLLLSAIVLYTYVGYGIVLWFMVKVKQLKERSA